MNVCAVVLAAGEGKRMKSPHAKVAHLAAGKPLVCWVRDALNEAGIAEQVFVVGHRQEEVRDVLGSEAKFVVQDRQLGTGHAVMQARPFLQDRSGCTLILYGDTPLIRAATLRLALDCFTQSGAAAVVITSEAPDPTGYGRIVRDDQDRVRAIVEQRDATPSELAIREINSGMYCFDTLRLLDTLGKISNNNKQGEYYITDAISILIDEGYRVETVRADYAETQGVNDPAQLEQAARILALREAAAASDRA